MSGGPWLTLIGIGEDGRDGLSPAAARALAQAELVVGAKRHLDLAAPIAAETLQWPSPLTDALPAILARRGTAVVVIASGDPFFYGVGTLLCQSIAPNEMMVLPGISSFSLAAARLGWSLQDCELISLHGRPFERLIPALQPGARILALSWDGTTPAKVVEELTKRGLGGSRVCVLEAMGGRRERVRHATAEGFDLADIDALNVVAVEVVAAAGAKVLPLTAGRAADCFEHDGQITKREVRAMALAALAPRRGELLWDIGAGSGSIGIEWMLAHAANRAIAIEPRADRTERIRRNALALGVPDLTVIEGPAPAAFAGLSPPQAIFIGGGGTTPGLIEAALAALPPGGRLVAHAVTLETEMLLVEAYKRYGGELTQIAVSHAEPLGGFLGWWPARPVVQWRLETAR
ncbi:MAG: precorrin-6y C5,15-methyltransferase (decarboxylating) subunit CbiE [Ancalomicrobiaceae bacterium]|nr:precorrin-6y C5,15-methyltransferase (decarboxylating) subunit CbiE [Ancalomicrobiaceae bacterium]